MGTVAGSHQCVTHDRISIVLVASFLGMDETARPERCRPEQLGRLRGGNYATR